MDSRTQTPIHAVCFCAFLSLLLGLISFAGPLAITAVFTMSVVCQYIGFVTPIIARFIGGSEFIHGPFNLGIMVGTICWTYHLPLTNYIYQSGPVAFIASFYMLFMIVVLLFPSSPGATSQSMNYTVVVAGGVILLSLAYYFFPKYGGRYWFKGPVYTIKGVDETD